MSCDIVIIMINQSINNQTFDYRRFKFVLCFCFAFWNLSIEQVKIGLDVYSAHLDSHKVILVKTLLVWVSYQLGNTPKNTNIEKLIPTNVIL